MTPSSYTIIRDMDPDRPSGQFTTEDPEEADEFLEMAHARRPWARITIYNEEGRILRRVKARNWVDEAGETPIEDTAVLGSRRLDMGTSGSEQNLLPPTEESRCRETSGISG